MIEIGKKLPYIHFPFWRSCSWLLRLTIALVLLTGSPVPGRVSAQKASSAVAPDFDAVDRYVQAEMQAVRIPGLALAIVHGDQIVHLKGFGVADSSGRPVTPQTPFNIGSTTKAFTALAVMQLVEAGRIELASPVQRYLPWFRVADPDASSRITVQDLLNHTSGLPLAVGNDYPGKDDTSDAALELRVRALSNAQLNHPVGTTHEYSNANYDTLGLIVQVVSGLFYEDYLMEHIFTPLEMHNSFTSRAEAQQHGLATGYRMWFGFPLPFTEPAPKSHLPSGHQFSTAEDLAHLLIAHLNDGRYQSSSVLSSEGIQAMQNTPVSSGQGCATYSMHWGHSSHCDTSQLSLGGDAANFKARALLSPQDRWAVVILMNTQAIGFNGPRQDRIKDGIFSLLLGEPPVEAAVHNIPVVAGFGFITIVTILLGVGVFRSLARLRRWTSHREQQPRTFLRVGWQFIVPLTLDILWIILLIAITNFAAGSLSARPLLFMLENTPDLGWMILLSAILALGLGLLRVIMAFMVLRTR